MYCTTPKPNAKCIRTCRLRLLLLDLLRLGGLLGGLDGLLALGLAELGLLVPLGQDGLDGEVTDGAGGELHGALHALLGRVVVGVQALLVLAAVEHGPGDVTGVALHEGGALALLGQEDVDLENGTDHLKS